MGLRGEPEGEGQQDGHQGQGVGERAGAVEQEVELGQGHQGEPHRHPAPEPPPHRALEHEEGCEDEAAQHQAGRHLLAEPGEGGEAGELHQGPGQAGHQQRAQEGARHHPGEGVVVVALEVQAVVEDVVDGLEVEALLHLGVGADEDVCHHGGVQEDVESSLQPGDRAATLLLHLLHAPRCSVHGHPRAHSIQD